MKSDIWSFGVVLWEIFSLGKEPYGFWKKPEELIEKIIKNGYRLTCPEEVTLAEGKGQFLTKND